MIKRYIAFLAGLLCFSLCTYAQPAITVSGGSANPGSTIDIDFTVDDFENYISLQFSINWDETVLEYSQLKNLTTELPNFSPSLFGTNAANVDNGIITLSWFEMLANPVTVDDGTLLFTVEFNVIGEPCDETLVAITGTPLEIEVGDENEMNVGLSSVDGMFEIPGTNCGEPSGVTVTAGTTTADAGSTVCVPFTIESTSDLGSLQFTINFNQSILSYSSLQNFGLPGLNAGNFNTEQSGNGLISLVWFDQSGTGVTVPNGTTIFEVCFNVIGSGGQMSNITFSDDIVEPEAADGDGTVVDFTGVPGKVTVTGDIEGFAFITQDQTVSGPIGTEVCVDVTVNDFILITAMQGTLTWDPDILEFDHFENLTNIPDLSTSSFFQNMPGVMAFLWFDNTTLGVTVDNNTVIFTLCFTTLQCDVTTSLGINSSNLELIVADDQEELDVSVVTGNITLDCDGGCGFTYEVTNPLCPGDMNGTIDITPTGECVTPITYNWSNGATTQDLTGLDDGCYNVTITTGDNDIHILQDICLEDPDPITASATITDVVNGGDGAINLSVMGGNGPYMFLWSPGNGTTEDLSNLDGGSYTVTITDANGCMVTAGPYVVGSPTCINAQVTNACNGADGAINITVDNCGTSPFTFAWDNGPTTEDLSGLGGGVYCVTVTDNGGTTNTACYTIQEADTPLNVDVDVTHETNGCDGAISLTASGGQPGYAYTWSTGGPSTPNRNNLCAGEYTITITDQYGCQVVETVFVVGDELAVLIDVSDNNGFGVSCFGECDATAIANVLNAVGNVSYNWSSGQTGPAVTDACAGNYSLTVTDEAGQTATASVTIDEPAAISIELDVECASEPGIPDGSAQAVVTGGVAPYTYLWNDASGSTTSGVQNQKPGQLVLFVQDDNGCEIMQNVEICISGIECYEAISVITPNGDDKNDRFVIQCIYDYPTRLSVYETYRGGLEFEMENYDNSWEGTNMQGDPLPDGGYHWVLEVMLPNNDSRVYQGTVNILRKLY